MTRPRAAVLLAAAIAAAAVLPAGAGAQESWDASLLIMPYPSPYLSDWETNPNIATYTLINGTGRQQDVVLHYEVRNQGGVVVTAGYSDPQPIAPGVPAIYTSFTEMAGNTSHDAVLEDQVTRSGRMPEGDYTACVVAASTAGFVLARACETFTVVYPDPPMLIGPGDGEVVAAAAPIFQWTPLQLPADFTLHYVLQIAEVKPGQTPYVALTSNIPQYENLDVVATSLTYPVDGLPLESGRTYAWRVVAMDQNGYAAAANAGSSEIWTFEYDDGAGDDDGGGRWSAITLDLDNDPASSRGSAPPDDGTTGLGEICSEWDVSSARASPVSLMIFPSLFPRIRTDRGTLVRRELPGGHRVWAASNERDYEAAAVMLYGDCDGPQRKTVLRWIGVRRTGETQELAAWLGGKSIDSSLQADSALALLKFGVGIFSLYDMTATGDSLEPVRAFLEDRSIDVQPGFNLYGIVDGSDTTSWIGKKLGGIADGLHTTTKDFEIQGFLGMNNSISGGVSFGRGGGQSEGFGADLSLETAWLVLRGALPAWERPWGSEKIKSVQLGILIVVKDSAWVGAGSARPDEGSGEVAWDVVPALTVTVVTADDVTWEGSVGVDFTKLNLLQTDLKLVVKLTTDHKWQPGRLAGTQWYLGNPEVELDIEDLRTFFSEGKDWSLGVGASLGWGSEATVAKAGITIGRKGHASNWSELVAWDSALAKADSVMIETSEANLRRAELFGDTAAAATYRAQIEERKARLAQTLRSLRADLLALEQWNRAAAQGRKKPGPSNPPPTTGMWWRARLALGNMSLLDFLDLIRKATSP